MRMWKVDPSRMCRQHLLGEHLEMHMFVGSINKGINLGGYISKGLVEVHYIKDRHSELVQEMEGRRYHHRSPLPEFKEFEAGKVSTKDNEKELGRRCRECQFKIGEPKSKPNRREVQMETNAQKSALSRDNLRSLAVELNRCGIKTLTANFINSKLPKETLLLDLEDAINEIFIATKEQGYSDSLVRDGAKAAWNAMVDQRNKRLVHPEVVEPSPEPETEEVPAPTAIITGNEEHLRFLDDLRDSGVTNMFGAASYLVDAFGLDKKTARAVLQLWMSTFSDRHPSPQPAAAKVLVTSNLVVPVTDPSETKPDKKPRKVPTTKVPPVIQNGIRKPKPEGKCGQAWAIFDSLLEKDGVVDSAKAVEWALEGGLNPGNVRTELGCWKKFHGRTKPKPAIG
jgi:hypothetical protein